MLENGVSLVTRINKLFAIAAIALSLACKSFAGVSDYRVVSDYGPVALIHFSTEQCEDVVVGLYRHTAIITPLNTSLAVRVFCDGARFHSGGHLDFVKLTQSRTFIFIDAFAQEHWDLYWVLYGYPGFPQFVYEKIESYK